MCVSFIFASDIWFWTKGFTSWTRVLARWSLRVSIADFLSLFQIITKEKRKKIGPMTNPAAPPPPLLVLRSWSSTLLKWKWGYSMLMVWEATRKIKKQVQVFKILMNKITAIKLDNISMSRKNNLVCKEWWWFSKNNKSSAFCNVAQKNRN